MTGSQRWKTLVCFVLIYIATLSGSATEIRLKSRVDSQGSVVLLGDIANLRADTPAARSLAGGRTADVSSLARIELFPAPGVSRSRTIKRREIRELLSLHGVDLRSINFVGAESVTITSSKRAILRKVANSSNLPLRARNQSFPNARPIAQANQGPATEMVFALVTGVRRGAIIRESNVQLISLPLSGVGSAEALGVRPVLHTKSIIGMEATRAIVANQPLDERAIKPRIVVKRNDKVTVTSRAPGVLVTTVARALDNGAVGDVVQLQSLRKNKNIYTARVTGVKTADVFATGIRVSSSPTVQPRITISSALQRRAAR
jgi:flagella basal body P-ring formation protein FlgA